MVEPELAALATPLRTAQWHEREGRIIIIRPPAGSSWLSPRRWFQAIFEPRRWRLDDLGSFCWRRLDGERTVGQLAEELRATYGEQAEPAEERIGHFLHVLVREGMARRPSPQHSSD